MKQKIIKQRKDGVRQRYLVGRRTIKYIYKKGKMHRTLSGPEVIKQSNVIKKQFTPLSTRIQIAGSIRRGKPNPTDIDVVLIPKDKQKIKHKIGRLGKIDAAGEQMIQSRIKGIDTDFYFATKDDFGGMMMHKTGPLESNISKAVKFKKRGYTFNQHGVTKNGKIIAGKTEKDIFKLLGEPYKPPELRGI